MTDNAISWRRLHEDGTEWETRLVAQPGQAGAVPGAQAEILEFVCVDGSRRTRSVVVAVGTISTMDEAALRRIYRRARPIAGDYYGRPGKPMNDAV